MAAPFQSPADELAFVLALDPIEVNLFRGRSPAEPASRIFGGQVVAQALTAAYKTVEGRPCHSLQSYFIRPGDPSLPVLYQVERSRDGKSFTTRRVIAIQKGEQIFNMACSFQTPEQGLEHQDSMPATPAPDKLQEERARVRTQYADQADVPAHWRRDLPIEMRAAEPVDALNPSAAAPVQRIWCRARADLGDDVALNQAMLAYASDFSLLSTSLRPHGVGFADNMQIASLDHIVWFHRPSNFSRWHLYVQDSPSASGARGFNRGSIFSEDGVLVASIAQEGLIRARG